MIEPIETSAVEQPATANENVSLLRILTWLLRGKRTILATGVIFALCGLVLSLVMRPKFTAVAEILPPQQSPSSSAVAMLSQMGSSSSASGLGAFASAIQEKTVADTYAVMLAARPLEDALIKRFDLQAVYHARTMTAARKALESQTKITPLKEGFITIAVSDRQPERAALLANGYVEELRNLMKGLALTGASQRRIFYEGQLAKSKDDLSNAEVAFQQMQQSNHMISVDAQTKTLIEGAADLRAQLAAKEVELQGMRAYSTEANPKVQIAEKELSALRAQEAQMDAQSQGSYSDVGLSSVPSAELKFVRASRELKYQDQLYDLLMKDYEAARIDEAADAPIVQVVAPAIAPERKSSPRRTLIVLGALLLGFFLGAVRVLYRSWRAGLPEADRLQLEEVRKAAWRWSA